MILAGPAVSDMKDSSTKPYPDVVYQRLRHILMSYRNLRSSETGGPYDWADLVNDIAYYCDSFFPKNSLENFVRGWHEDTGKRASGRSAADPAAPSRIHKFSIPKPERVEAIIEFLTNPDSRGYFCDREVLLASSGMQAPYFLQHYLDNEQEPGDFHAINSRPEQYHCHYAWNDPGRSWDFYLEMLSPIANGAAFVDVVVKPRSEHLPPIDAPLSPGAATYSGWAVRDHQQNLFIFVKHIRNMSTVFYLALGYGSRSPDHPFPLNLTLLEHHSPVPDGIDGHPHGEGRSLDTVKQDLLDSIYTLTLETISRRQR